MELKTKFDYGDNVVFLTTDLSFLDANSEKASKGLMNGEILVCEGEIIDIEIQPIKKNTWLTKYIIVGPEERNISISENDVAKDLKDLFKIIEEMGIVKYKKQPK